MLNNIQAVLFDVDGTLVQHDSIVREFYQKHIKAVGLTMSYVDSFRAITGFDATAGYKNLKRHHDDHWKLSDAWFNNAMQSYAQLSVKHGLQVIEGIEESLKFLNANAVPIAIVSNSGKDNLHEKLRQTNLAEHFLVENVFAGGDENAPKPSAEILHLAAEKMSVKIESCVLIGDSLADVWAAKVANCLMIATVADKLPKHHSSLTAVLEEEGADLVVNSSQELLQYFKLNINRQP